VTTQNSKGMDFLHEIGSRLATVDELHDVLKQIVDFLICPAVRLVFRLPSEREPFDFMCIEESTRRHCRCTWY
jgi:hypothetical protein